jgi:hypothetical protein
MAQQDKVSFLIESLTQKIKFKTTHPLLIIAEMRPEDLSFDRMSPKSSAPSSSTTKLLQLIDNYQQLTTCLSQNQIMLEALDEPNVRQLLQEDHYISTKELVETVKQLYTPEEWCQVGSSSLTTVSDRLQSTQCLIDRSLQEFSNYTYNSKTPANSPSNLNTNSELDSFESDYDGELSINQTVPGKYLTRGTASFFNEIEPLARYELYLVSTMVLVAFVAHLFGWHIT